MLALLLAVGCVEYGLHKPGDDDAADTPATDAGVATDVDTATPGDTAATGSTTATETRADASFSVVIQYAGFADEVGRCQVEVAFYEVDEDDGSGGGAGQEIAVPTTPGTCAFTAFDPDAETAAGSMDVRGTLEAGEVTLDDGEPVALPATSGSDGAVTYRMADCGRDTFPFGRTFDLVGTGATGGIPAFSLDDAVAVGPDLARVLPADADIAQNKVVQPISAPLEWSWAYLDDPPVTGEGAVVADTVFTLRTSRRSDQRLLEALACRPDEEGRVTVAAADLSQLTPTPADDSAYTMGQVDVSWDGLQVDAPWGQVVKVRSLVSISGEVVLTE